MCQASKPAPQDVAQALCCWGCQAADDLSEASALNDAYQDHHQGNDQQNMDEAAQGVGGHQTQKPEEYECDGNSFKHDGLCLFGFVYFVANDATDCSATQRPGRAAAGQDRAADSANPRADGGVFFLLRHAGAGAQRQRGHGEQG